VRAPCVFPSKKKHGLSPTSENGIVWFSLCRFRSVVFPMSENGTIDIVRFPLCRLRLRSVVNPIVAPHSRAWSLGSPSPRAYTTACERRASCRRRVIMLVSLPCPVDVSGEGAARGTCHKCGGSMSRGNKALARKCGGCGTSFHASDCGQRLANAGCKGPYDVCPKVRGDEPRDARSPSRTPLRTGKTLVFLKMPDSWLLCETRRAFSYY